MRIKWKARIGSKKSKRIEGAKNGVLRKGYEYFVIIGRGDRSPQFLFFSFNQWDETSCGKAKEVKKEEIDRENKGGKMGKKKYKREEKK